MIIERFTLGLSIMVILFPFSSWLIKEKVLLGGNILHHIINFKVILLAKIINHRD